MLKRVNELQVGEIFWFSEGWQRVQEKNDRNLMYSRAFKKSYPNTINASSVMTVKIFNTEKHKEDGHSL